jgi:hypothetical protein
LTGTAAHVTQKGYLQPNAIAQRKPVRRIRRHPRGFEV